MQRDRTHIAVLCLDIDKFKEINEAADHAAAIRCCATSAARIQSTLRDNDLIARLAGDEFAIALVDITNLGDVMAFMNRLVEALRRPLQVGDKDMPVTHQRRHRAGPRRRRHRNDGAASCRLSLSPAPRATAANACASSSTSMDKALQRRRMVEHELGLRSGARSSRWSTSRNTTSPPSGNAAPRR